MAAGEVEAIGIDVATMVTNALGQTLGTQKTHYLNAVIAALGAAPKLIIKRNDTTVYQTVYTSDPSVSSGNLSIPAALNGTPSTNDAADIDSGTWTLDIEKASDSGVKLRMTLGPVGGETLSFLSQDLDGTSVIAPTVMLLSAPTSLDDGYNPGGGTIGSLTVDTIINDMGLSNDDAAFGFSNWWSRNPPTGITNGFNAWGTNWDSSVQAEWFRTQSNIGSWLNTRYWRFFQPWMVPYTGDNQSASCANMALRFRRFRFLGRRRSDQQWVVLRSDNSGTGAGFFQARLGNAISNGQGIASRQVSNYVEMQYKNIFNTDEVEANNRYVHHGVWSSKSYMDESVYDILMCAMIASLQQWDPYASTVLTGASPVLAVGGDPYPATNYAPSQSGNLPSFAHSRLKKITTTEQWFTNCTLLNCFQDHEGPTAGVSAQSLINNPPPAYMLADGDV